MKTRRNKRRNSKHKRTRTRRGGNHSSLNVGSNKVQDKIKDINTSLEKKCPGMYLVLNHRENLCGNVSAYNETTNPKSSAMKDVTLCLYKKGDCVSSITIKPSGESSVTIDSRTAEEEQKKKYNTFLRMCAILLVNEWGIKKIESHPENPITLWLFSKYFLDHITFDRDFIAFLDEHIQSKNETTIEKMKESGKSIIESRKQIGNFLAEKRKPLLRDKNFYKEIIEGYLELNVVTITLNINEPVLEIANNNIETLLSEHGIKCK